jgi:hypothetical protein
VKAIAAYLGLGNRLDTKALIDGLSDTGRAMDQAYPGYWQAKILYRLVQKAEAA